MPMRDGAGRAPFAIPVERSSHERTDLVNLDKITMAEYLNQNGYTSENMKWYALVCVCVRGSESVFGATVSD